MSKGVSKIFDVMKNTAEKEASNSEAQLVSISVKTTSPLVFNLDDRTTITQEFYTLDKALDETSLQVGDVLNAIVLNKGQMYYILNNSAGGGSGTTNYNDLSNKPKINNIELSGNKTGDDLGVANKIEKIKVNGVIQTIVNKIVDIFVPTKTSQITNDSGYISSVDGVVKVDKLAVNQNYDASEDSKLQVNGSINIPYSNNNGAYKVNGNLVLRHNSNGNTLLIGNGSTMYLRPNGSDATRGQVTLGTDGTFKTTDIDVSGSYKIDSNVVLTNRDDGRTIICGNNGNIQFRPDGSTTSMDISPSSNLTIGNNISAGGLITASGGVKIPALNSTGEQIRLYKDTSSTGYGALIRNDGSATFILLTDAGGQASGSYNSLRPFRVDNATGKVDISNGLQVVNGLTVPGGAGDKRFKVRNIVGIKADNTAEDNLYLQYGNNHPIVLGETGSYNISGDGSLYNGTSANSNKGRLTLTNPSSGTWYYPTWVAGIENNTYYDTRGNNGLRYYTLEGTTSANGRCILQVGNGTKSGTAGNKYGQLRIYHTNTGAATLQYRDTTTSCTLTLPAHDGNMIGRINLYYNTSGTTGNVTLSETAANFDALEITYKDSSHNAYGYSKIYNPDGKTFWLNYAEFGTSTGQATLFGRSYSISGTTITASSSYGYMGLADSAATHTNRFQIVRVDGIKG